MTEKNYSFGVEEEYFIVDGDTKALRKKAAPAFLTDLKRKVGTVMNREMLQSQLEISTKPSLSMEAIHDDLRNLRQTIGSVAADHGLSYFAASTHPTAGWSGGQPTQKIRYDGMMQDLQMLGERNLLCGMHVHVQLPDVDRRVDVMRRMIPYSPLFIALSTSSPFWRSRSTGLMGYRLAAYDELPRTGIPELFESNADYEAYINALIETRVIQDSSYIWWTIRPSAANPTLELRAPDVCTRVEDAVSLAALYRALARHLYNHPELNRNIGPVDRAIAVENKWRAQRYGIHGSFVDRGEGRAVPISEELDRLIVLLQDDIGELRCEDEIAHVRKILSTGTSADMQIAVFREAEQRTGSRNKAFGAVKTWLAEATLQ
ncbi:MAG TPA: carboxylate-amine ligase [Xanthobacteraceae bacterium]|nr:carboxylate-amine ligase [Xanthobacteraceae bacterium]